jgi:hypothetical protein
VWVDIRSFGVNLIFNPERLEPGAENLRAAAPQSLRENLGRETGSTTEPGIVA